MRQQTKHYARPPFSCRSRRQACFSFPQILFIHSTADRAADQLPDTWSSANGTCQEASQGSLTSCSKNRSSRVLSPGLLPAPSNSSLYSCRKALHEDIPCTQAQQHLRAPCVRQILQPPCQVRGQRSQESCPFSEMCSSQRRIIALSLQEKGHQVQTPPRTDWSVWARPLCLHTLAAQ